MSKVKQEDVKGGTSFAHRRGGHIFVDGVLPDVNMKPMVVFQYDKRQWVATMKQFLGLVAGPFIEQSLEIHAFDLKTSLETTFPVGMQDIVAHMERMKVMEDQPNPFGIQYRGELNNEINFARG